MASAPKRKRPSGVTLVWEKKEQQLRLVVDGKPAVWLMGSLPVVGTALAVVLKHLL